MKVFQLGVVVILFSVASIFGLTLAEAQAPPSQDPGHVRYEFARRTGWGSTVTAHNPQTFTLFDRNLATPASTPTVDVVVTISLDYGVSRGDFAEIGASYRPTDDPGASFRPLSPGQLGRLSSARQRNRTTTSITWIAKGLAASGQSYQFQIGVAARDNDDDARAQATGKNFSVVVDMVSSEDA
jgi:hypothetical protein